MAYFSLLYQLSLLNFDLNGTAPTWAGAGRDSRRPVGVARRWDKALPAGRRQHGRQAGGIRADHTIKNGLQEELVLLQAYI